jgi:hypothetical protein
MRDDLLVVITDAIHIDARKVSTVAIGDTALAFGCMARRNNARRGRTLRS